MPETNDAVKEEGGKWIRMDERMPTEADADMQGCVLAWRLYQHTMVMHIRNLRSFGALITHWMPTPAGPMV